MVWCLSCHRTDARLFKRLCGYKDESVLYNKTILTSVRPTCQGHFPNDALSPPTILDCGKRRRPQTASRNRVFREDLAAAAAATMVALAQDTDYALHAAHYALLYATLHYNTRNVTWASGNDVRNPADHWLHSRHTYSQNLKTGVLQSACQVRARILKIN